MPLASRGAPHKKPLVQSRRRAEGAAALADELVLPVPPSGSEAAERAAEAEGARPLGGEAVPSVHHVVPRTPLLATTALLKDDVPLIPEEPSGPLVAVVNHDDGLGEDVRHALEAEGWRTVASKVITLEGDKVDLLKFLQDTDPDVVVFDVVQPFADHLATLRELRDAREARDRSFIVTTTDRTALAAHGLAKAVQFREPEDLVDLTRAVRDALAVR
jgi:CheY-like chemotaxis protein